MCMAQQETWTDLHHLCVAETMLAVPCCCLMFMTYIFKHCGLLILKIMSVQAHRNVERERVCMCLVCVSVGQTDNLWSNEGPLYLRSNEDPLYLWSNEGPLYLRSNEDPLYLRSNEDPLYLRSNEDPLYLWSNEDPLYLWSNEGLLYLWSNEGALYLQFWLNWQVRSKGHIDQLGSINCVSLCNRLSTQKSKRRFVIGARIKAKVC